MAPHACMLAVQSCIYTSHVAIHNLRETSMMEGPILNLPVSIAFLLLYFLTTATISLANIADFDETWQKRAEEARESSLMAYHPDPFSVNSEINQETHRPFNGSHTRRHLRRYKGPCQATNPVDRCWRCDPRWASHRKKLTKCVLGFGRRTIGGRRGRYYVVRDASDNSLTDPKPGTLRHAVTRKQPLWIIFAHDMIIRLHEELIVASYKTIDGRGANVHIAYGAQITIQFVRHVIIHGIHIHHIYAGGGGLIRDSVDHFGFRTASDGDGISVFGASNVWIDHVSMYRCTDGLIDIVQGSTAITVTNGHFTRHDHVMLFGASDSYDRDSIMQVTVAFNHFGKGLIQRMPRCRYGFFHVLNNDYTHWKMYAIGGSQNPTIISSGNRYIAPHCDSQHNASQVTKRENTNEAVWKNWIWRSEDDQLKNGAYFIQSGPPIVDHGFSRKDKISSRPGTHAGRLTRFAGALTCRKNHPC